MTEPKKPILDIDDRQKSFQLIAKRIELLNEGFRALYADYSHHIEIAHGKDHDIFKLKENIGYRLFSSKFHLELLLRQHFSIENRFEEVYQKNPRAILGPIYPSNPLFDHCQSEITSIFDSIIFHLASVYDYLSAIVNFVCNKKDKSITKWSQLANSCRGLGNTYSTKQIAKVILDENNEFVSKLYKYRSRVIHESAEVYPISLTIQMASGKTNVNLLTSNSLTKNFKELKEKSLNNNLTVSYTSEWLIHKTITSIVNILFGLKAEMEQMSTFPNHIASNEFIVLSAEPGTGKAEPVSKSMWKNVKDNIGMA